jgi:hypothetical protein
MRAISRRLDTLVDESAGLLDPNRITGTMPKAPEACMEMRSRLRDSPVALDFFFSKACVAKPAALVTSTLINFTALSTRIFG